ncbi:hypothetical protein RRF57_000140 [Xylaria bambusicola]|uniref:Uncharacterized protein n=1 Tax=Xylaria bambusicola TaxID=326684 RepID=A0AAN7YTX0_9PEZI
MEEIQLARQFSRIIRIFHVYRKNGTKAIWHLFLQPFELLSFTSYLQACMLDIRNRATHHAPLAPSLGFQPPDQVLRVSALLAHAQLQGAKTADTEPSLQTPHHRPQKNTFCLQRRKPLLRVPRRDS